MSSSYTTRIEVLGKENFDTWKLQVKAFLVKNDAWEYVSGEKARPTVADGVAASFAAA